jgi:TetR/AcrR family transcriptional regulator, transcriptional repressor for nem operon
MKPESDTKQKLLDTAMEMIWESSYGSVSVDDICTKAGVKKGSFYHAFKSKSDLAVAAFERVWEHKRPLLDSVFSTQVPPLERLERYCQVIIDDQLKKYQSFGKMLGCPFCSVGSELSTQDENIRKKAEMMGHRMERYIESAIRDLAAEGLIESKDHAELTQEISSYLTGTLMQAKIENNPRHVERLKHGVMRLLGLKQLQTTAA